MTSARVTSGAVDPQRLRRWIRQRRVAAHGRVSIGTIYSVGLGALMAGALLGQPILSITWPADTAGRNVASVAALVALLPLGLFIMLRQFGPLVVGRADASWLLPAPVPRRILLAPALFLVAIGTAAVGAFAGLVLVGHLATRPVGTANLIWTMTAGVVAGLAVGLAAVYCQYRPAAAQLADLAATVGASGCLVLAAVPLATGWVGSWLGWRPATPGTVAGLGLLLAAAIGAYFLTWRGLDAWPTHRIANASVAAAAYADVIYSVEPSFLANLREQRFWRSRPPSHSFRLQAFRPIPLVVVHDLLIVWRKARRLPWLAATTVLPALVASGPTWLLIGIFLAGALTVAGLTMDAVRTDTQYPALRRLLGLSARDTLRHRIVIPSILASIWCALALTWLAVTGEVPMGPWWALGLVVGPAVAAAAIQRAKSAVIDTGLLVDTPLGAFPVGMLLSLVNGVGVIVVLAFPTIFSLANRHAGTAPGWFTVLIQAMCAVFGTYLYLRRTQLPRSDAT